MKADLISQAKLGDQQAIAGLYEQTYDKVYYTVRSMIKDEDAAFDIIQDAYIKAFSHLDGFEGDDITPWIKTIAANTARDWLKKKRPMLFSELNAGEDGDIPAEEMFEDDNMEHLPEQVIEQQETTRLVREILEELPEDQRAVIGMYYYEELTVKEIALATGATESAVKSRLMYGRKKIEKKVKELEKKGTKLYGLLPIPFLRLLLRSMDLSGKRIPDEQILKNVLTDESVIAAAGSSSSAAAGGAASALSAAVETAGGAASVMSAAGAAAGAAAAGSISVVKIALGILAAAVVIGGGSFGILRHLESRRDNNRPVPPPETTYTAESAAPATGAVTETGTAAEPVSAEEPQTETQIPQTEEPSSEAVPTELLMEQYQAVLDRADSYDYGYDRTYTKPTGRYRYALVLLKEGDTVPALLLSQETDDYMEHARVFLYDPAEDEMMQPEEALLMGAAGIGGYRGGLTLGQGRTGLQLTVVSSGTGATDISLITVDGDKLEAAAIWSGRMDNIPEKMVFEEIEWYELTDRTGLESLKEPAEPAAVPAGNTAQLPSDGDRIVLTGTINTYTHEELLKLQGIKDPNPGSGAGWTYRVIVLDTPQMLKGRQDIDEVEREAKLICVLKSTAGLKFGEDLPADLDGKHVIFSFDRITWPSDTSLPLGEPSAYDIHILQTDD